MRPLRIKRSIRLSSKKYYWGIFITIFIVIVSAILVEICFVKNIQAGLVVGPVCSFGSFGYCRDMKVNRNNGYPHIIWVNRNKQIMYLCYNASTWSMPPLILGPSNVGGEYPMEKTAAPAVDFEACAHIDSCGIYQEPGTRPWDRIMMRGGIT